MSDLLFILVVLGVLIVVGVVVFNWWQERKFQQKISGEFKPSRRDVLIEDFQINTSAAGKKDKTTPKIDTSHHREPEVDLFAFTEPNVVEDDAEPKLHDDIASGEMTLEAPATPIKPTAPAKAAPASPPVESFNPSERLHAEQELPTKTKPVLVSDDTLLPEDLHAQIDLIALLYASIPVTQPRVMSVLASHLKEFTERNFGFGLSHTNEWVSLIDSKPEAMFSKLAFSLQLADRGGAVTRATLNRYQHMVETMGLELGTHVEWQNVGDPLNAATTLDQFCIDVDKTVGFHLVTATGAAFHATKFRGLMEAQGLVLGQDGRFHLYHAQVPDLLEFSVKNYEGNPFSPDMLKSAAMHGVTFQLDIPTVKNSLEVFDRMIQVAKMLAKNLDAAIVDDNRKVLGDLQLEKIRQQLKMINATMIAKGIIPGSPQALRLFS